MKPVTPIVPGMELPETIYAKDQPPYRPLHVFKYYDGTVLSRWKLTLRERIVALFRGDVYVWIRTFNQPLQPLWLEVDRPTYEEQRQPNEQALQTRA